jgi:hypothetical protein
VTSVFSEPSTWMGGSYGLCDTLAAGDVGDLGGFSGWERSSIAASITKRKAVSVAKRYVIGALHQM